MIVSNRHFEPTMARGVKRYQVVEQVGILLVCVIAPIVLVVNIKGTPAWAMTGPTVLACLVALKYLLANLCPPPTKGKLFPASPVGAMLSGHMFNRAFSGTVFTPVFSLRREHIKRLSAIGTREGDVRLHSAGIGTFSRTVLDLFISLVKALSTMCAFGVVHSRPTPSNVTLSRTKHALCILSGAGRHSLKSLVTMQAGQGFLFSNGIYGAFTRTVIDVLLVSFELLPTLEAYLDHC